MPGTAIHEFYHFVQAHYTRGMVPPQYGTYGWVKEAGSTWIEEKAPETIGVFRNTFFLSKRNDLFTGLYPTLAARDGYGKAPIMKYVADRWGTGQVRAIFERIGSGNGAVDAVLGGIPVSPAEWWPDLLTQYMTGQMIALTAEELPPTGSQLAPQAGRLAHAAGPSMRNLSARFIHFTPAPAAYGTGTNLTFRLTPAQVTAGVKYLPFRMGTGGRWEAVSGPVDSLVIAGTDLRLGRRYGIFLIHTQPVAPYTATVSSAFGTDLGYTDGDWRTTNVTVTDNAITYSATDDDGGGIDVPGSITSVFATLSDGGIWKRTDAAANVYVWEATPAFAQEMAELNMALTSRAEVRTNNTLKLEAMLDYNPPESASAGTLPGGPAMAGFAVLFLVGWVVRRDRRLLVLIIAVGGAAAVASCDGFSFSATAKFRYEFELANPALTASLTDEMVPLVQLSGGTGRLIVDRYRLDLWEYIREDGVVVDSVLHRHTASGQATVRLDAHLYRDGLDFGDDDDDYMVATAAQLLRLTPEVIEPQIRARRQR
jgi:hypothetical protein